MVVDGCRASLSFYHGFQMAKPEQLKNLIDEDALQRAREKRQKVEQGVTEKVSITKRMYGALDTCIKNIGERGAVCRMLTCLRCTLLLFFLRLLFGLPGESFLL